MPNKKRTAQKKTSDDENSRLNESHNLWRKRLRYLESRNEDIVHTICGLVKIESPSDNSAAINELASHVINEFAPLGGNANRHRSNHYGDHLQIDFASPNKHKPVLLLGHLDTVYPLGTLKTMPCRIANGRLHGPGVLDMKAGIALMRHAIAALQNWHGALPRPVTVFLVSDEEIGSRSSRPVTESLARNSAAVFVLEPAAGTRGALKTARKGVGEYTLNVQGIAAHAGLDPGKGHSAILELSRQIAVISKLNDLKRGISVNVGVIHGGTRTNVIAAEASAAIDVRIKSAKQAAGIDRRMRALRPFDRHCRLEIEGGINRLPMERTAGVINLFRQAQKLADQLDWSIEEAAVGGGSDGNFTAGIGIPTLDGMGGVGEGAHAVHEYITISELPRRALLLAAMIEAGTIESV